MLRKQSYKKECIQYHSMYTDLFRDASIGNKLMKESKNEITTRTGMAVPSGGRERILMKKRDTISTVPVIVDT